jgi:hypothetical protein
MIRRHVKSMENPIFTNRDRHQADRRPRKIQFSRSEFPDKL